jgi:hypothetical protein
VKKETDGCLWISLVLLAIPIVILIAHFYPDILPVSSVFDFWTIKGTLTDWINSSWALFAFGASFVIIKMLVKPEKFKPLLKLSGKVIVGSGLLVATWTGIMEEIGFRWILFIFFIGVCSLLNFLFFDAFGGPGLMQWLCVHIFAPASNFISLGLMENFFQKASWQVVGGLLFANLVFSDAHFYQGWLGLIISWFIGLFFFWTMLTYGLPVAMGVHFSYNLICFVTVSIFAHLGKANA